MTEHTRDRRPVLILGGGINGSALARELVLNGVPCWVVDKNDLAYGATSKSSRLIHGGLRYLEYGEFALVRESLEERNRLCRLAPQFVVPLRLYIPVAQRSGGLFRSAFRFVSTSRWSWLRRFGSRFTEHVPRGLWVVRLGLRFYDFVAGNGKFPRSRVHRTAEPVVPDVDAKKYRWLCAYTDAQIRFPERFVISQLEDARQLAAEQGIEFRVLTHHRAELEGRRVALHAETGDTATQYVEPAAVVNATGAWGDFTLDELEVESKKLFGGTKGSHIITHQAELRAAIGDAGIYAEASDGRLVFVLPFEDAVMVGTTDEEFGDRPDRAVATSDEIAYLIGMVNELFPDVSLGVDDVEVHYCGVRPLPAADESQNAAVSRDHWIVENSTKEVPVYTLVGGKLTTCRAFAEEIADRLFADLGSSRSADSRDRLYPGAANFPEEEETLRQRWKEIAEATGFSLAQVLSVWSLCGSQAAEILTSLAGHDKENVPGTELPRVFVDWVIEHEWAVTLGDLIERRLILVYEPDLSETCLESLADCLVAAGRLDRHKKSDAIAEATNRLAEFYGKSVVGVGDSSGVSRGKTAGAR